MNNEQVTELVRDFTKSDCPNFLFYLEEHNLIKKMYINKSTGKIMVRLTEPNEELYVILIDKDLRNYTYGEYTNSLYYNRISSRQFVELK